MKEFTYTITNPSGLHGRPAADLVTQVQAMDSTVTVRNGGKCVGADRLIALMTLGVAQGDTVTVTVEGGDEEKTLEQLRTYFMQNL